MEAGVAVWDLCDQSHLKDGSKFNPSHGVFQEKMQGALPEAETGAREAIQMFKGSGAQEVKSK